MIECKCLVCKRVRKEYKIYLNLKSENGGIDLNEETTKCLERIIK